jgi:pyrroloquinoline quinone biosynthesis protein B
VTGSDARCAFQAIVLGSAAGGGFPQWNSNASGCRRARSGDPAARPRTQSSLAVSADGTRWVLLNASPDLRSQIEATPQLHPHEGLRSTPIAAVVLTNADIDHVAGLLTMRESQPFALYATERVLAALDANPIFSALRPEVVPRRVLRLGERTALGDVHGAPLGLELSTFDVPGKVALYLENERSGPNFGTAQGDTIGVELAATGTGERPRLFYIPGCAAMNDALADRLYRAPIVLFDGTLWTDDEMIRAGVGTKTGKRMGHISMDGPDGSLAAFRALDVGRKIFVHMNNSNPVLLDDSPERARVVAAGWEVASDGMLIRL